MTHPLTPREKVRQIIDDALNSAIPEPWEVANHATDAILTALASGSGDHAELARLAEAAQSATSTEEGSRYGEYAAIADVVGRERTDFWFRANPATVLALLAENAALRESISRHDRQVSGMLRARLAAENRATEAERKLAEAEGLLWEAVDEFGCTIEHYHKNGPHWTSADGEMFDVGVVLDREPLIERARTFLNKEAERG